MATQAERIKQVEEDQDTVSQQVASFGARLDELEQDYKAFKAAVVQALRLELE